MIYNIGKKTTTKITLLDNNKKYDTKNDEDTEDDENENENDDIFL